MKRDVFLSLVLHLAVVGMAMLSSPFDVKVGQDYSGEVIRVSLLASSDLFPAEPVAVSIPEVATEEIPEIAISEPTTLDEAVIEQEAKPEPEQVMQDEPVISPHKPPVTGPGEGQEEIHSPITGGGSPFAGATIDNVSFDYPYWFTQAFNKILRNWRNPVSADGSIVCVVYFQVIKSGRVIETMVETSSGIRMFDDACLLAVERSTPFPPLPRAFGDEIIGITLPFKYEPR